VPQGWKDYSQVSLNLTWDLDFFGKNRASAKAAKADAATAAAEAADARLVLSTGIAAAYADLARLYAEFDACADALRVRTETTELIRDRRSRGLDSDGALSRALSGQESAQADLAALNEEIALRRNQIAALLGAGPDRGLEIARPSHLKVGAFGLPPNLPLQLIGRRPDILAARRRAEAAARRVGAARAAFYPDINLTPTIGLQALGIGNLVRSGADFGSVGPAVDLPIFEGGRLRGQLRQTEAAYEAAVAQYDGALAEALREVADAAVSERALTTRLDRSRAAETYAARAFKSATDRYRGGLATYLDVLTAEDALIVSRRAVAGLETRAFTLDVSLIRALGGGFKS
jgi:NodT family efflux transporter outer membrane factor (OMF) lipoprotein